MFRTVLVATLSVAFLFIIIDRPLLGADNDDVGHLLCKMRPADPDCVALHKKDVEDECSRFWNMPVLLGEKLDDPDCQAARKRAAAKAKIDAARAKAADDAKERKRVSAIDALPISDERKGALRAKKVFIGATEDMVQLAWGKPDRTNRTVTAAGRHEQWIYGDQYLYFENGIMTAAQTSN